jgi:DNA-directed RNA polymerase subunit alpha
VQKVRTLLEKSVEELELSVRSSNCLRAAEIRTLGDLVQKSEPEMLKFRNFGRKSLKEIQDILSEMGLHFGMDVSPYYEGKSAVRLDA